MPDIHRWWHIVKSAVTGHYVARCPLCGRLFGATDPLNGALMLSLAHGTSVCRHCADFATARNARLVAAHNRRAVAPEAR